MLMHNGVPMEYTYWQWDMNSAAGLEVKIGIPDFQTFWELFTVALALSVWGPSFVQESLALLCDNTGSLQQALDLKGSGPYLAIARELAVRKARGRWAFTPGHLPAEQNVLADALSRLHAPAKKAFPAALSAATHRDGGKPEGFWKLRM